MTDQVQVLTQIADDAKALLSKIALYDVDFSVNVVEDALVDSSVYVALQRVQNLAYARRVELQRAAAIQQISDNSYYAFSTDELDWLCVDCAIDMLFAGDWKPLLAYATGQSPAWTDQEGDIITALHDGSVEYATSQEWFNDGLSCSCCDAELLPPVDLDADDGLAGEDKEWEPDDLPWGANV